MSRVALSLTFVLCVACSTTWAQDLPGARPDQPGEDPGGADVRSGVGGADVRSRAPRPELRPAEPPIRRQPTARRPGQPPVGRPGEQPAGPQPGAPLIRRPAGVAVPPYETLVCPLENAPATDVGSTLNSLVRSLGMLEQLRSEVVIVPEVISNSLIISATPEDLEKVTRLVRQLDRPRPSVRVEVLIAEVQQDGQPTASSPEPPSGETGLGAAWEGWDFGEQRVGPNDLARLLFESGGARVAKDVRQRVRALETSGELKILSRPQITTLDNQPAHIHVGRKIPVPRATATTAAGGRTMSVAYEQVGVIVGLTPRISRGGRVTMEINVEKSGLGSAAPGGYPGGAAGVSDPGNVPRLPQNETVTLQTTVNLADGESTVIGGLAVESQPRQSKLVIVVTPHIIPPNE